MEITYTTSDPNPDYLQSYVDTDLTAKGWELGTTIAGMAQVGQTLPQPPGLATPTPKLAVTTTVTATADGVGVTYLPTPYPTTGINVSGTWRTDPATLMLASQNATIAGSPYTTTSSHLAPSPRQLVTAPSAPHDIRASQTEVPESYYTYGHGAILKLAEQITAGATSELAKAAALQNYLNGSGPFTYTLNSPTFNSPAGLYTFLTKSHIGYCVQFSSAMTILARMLGLPARLAVGYTQGTKIGNNTWAVKTSDAHSWPQLYFTGIGWLRFEPTPGGLTGDGTGVSPAYSDPVSAPGASSSSDGGAVQPTAPKGGIRRRPELAHQAAAGSRRRRGRQHRAGQGSGHAVGRDRARRARRDRAGRRTRRARLPAGTAGDGPRRADGAAADKVVAHRDHARGSRGRRDSAGAVPAAVQHLGAGARTWLGPRRHRLRRGRRGHDRGTDRRPGVAVRRWRWTKATDDASRAHAAWREFHDDLADFGVGYLPSESPRALAGRVGGSLGLPDAAREAVHRIALAEEQARYAARPSPSPTLRADGIAARRGLGRRPPGARAGAPGSSPHP